MKANNILKAKLFLEENQGYLKWGKEKLADKLNVSIHEIIAAKQMLWAEEEAEVVEPKANTKVLVSSDELEEFNEWKSSKAKPRETKLPKPYVGGNKSNVLVLADTHEPFCKQGYLEFAREMQELYDCGTIVHIGDEVDLCAISQWESDPDGFSAGSEAELAQEKMMNWYKVFPNCHVCIGNHTARPFRMARTAGIPKKFIKSYEEAWQAPAGWKWAENWEIDGVFYTHGTGLSGAGGAIKMASLNRQNCVIGHIHTEAGVQYNASKKDIVWGMQLGGAIDDKEYAFAYAKDQIKKSIVGVGVVLGGKLPIYLPMPL